LELPRRKPDDMYLPDGEFTAILERLRQYHDAHEFRIGIAYAFDFRTRMLPYWYADKRMAPCSVRTLGDALFAAGFEHVRIILQQWAPNFRPSEAVLDGRPLDILLVSSMQVHADSSYDLVRDACRLGDRRPLILAGGPKAIYEPTDYFELGPEPGVGADCVVTGEVYVLLHLLEAILRRRQNGESARAAFERARRSGALKEVLGLCYLLPDSSPQRPIAAHTGVQRLLRNFDELPMPDAGYRLLDPPHKKTTLSLKPCPANKVRRHSLIASIIASQGCKFNCPFCPIPAANQRTWRHKSPERFAAEIKHIYENFGIREFFGTDDNFFNRRETVIALMSELALATTGGDRLAHRIRFYTEGTHYDVYKNRDILPLCRKGGMRAIWFGIEDLTGKVVNKAQDADETAELFRAMSNMGVEPMVMMIHNDDQPLRSKNGSLAGVVNQARYVFDHGAVSYQCTYLGPAVGTRDFEEAAKARKLYKAVGGDPVPQAFQDGNHVVASKHPRPWEKEINLLRAYITFYNPVNLLRCLFAIGRDHHAGKRAIFQLIGHIGLCMSIPKMLWWARKLKRGPIEVWDGLQKARIPMVDAATGQEMNWAIEYIPSLDQEPKAAPSPSVPASGDRQPCGCERVADLQPTAGLA